MKLTRTSLKVTIEGLVRDAACPIQNLEATATHLSMKCLVACTRKGSPLVILTQDDELYLPISDEMPDNDQRQKAYSVAGEICSSERHELREERDACDRDP